MLPISKTTIASVLITSSLLGGCDLFESEAQKKEIQELKDTIASKDKIFDLQDKTLTKAIEANQKYSVFCDTLCNRGIIKFSGEIGNTRYYTIPGDERSMGDWTIERDERERETDHSREKTGLAYAYTNEGEACLQAIPCG